MTLDEKIKNRETELQMAYDNAVEEKDNLQLEINERLLKLELVRKRITDIEIRAIEQGVFYVLKI
jgi:hypothetical protein